MKKGIVLAIVMFLVCFALANKSIASGTTCTVTLSATTGHLITYQIQFEILDAWNGYSSYAGPTSWTSVSVGTTYNFPIPLDVIVDCNDRWVVKATVRQLYNGIPTGNTDIKYCGPLSSDEYYQGGFSFSLTI